MVSAIKEIRKNEAVIVKLPSQDSKVYALLMKLGIKLELDTNLSKYKISRINLFLSNQSD